MKTFEISEAMIAARRQAIESQYEDKNSRACGIHKVMAQDCKLAMSIRLLSILMEKVTFILDGDKYVLEMECGELSPYTAWVRFGIDCVIDVPEYKGSFYDYDPASGMLTYNPNPEKQKFSKGFTMFGYNSSEYLWTINNEGREELHPKELIQHLLKYIPFHVARNDKEISDFDVPFFQNKLIESLSEKFGVIKYEFNHVKVSEGLIGISFNFVERRLSKHLERFRFMYYKRSHYERFYKALRDCGAEVDMVCLRNVFDELEAYALLWHNVIHKDIDKPITVMDMVIGDYDHAEMFWRWATLKGYGYILARPNHSTEYGLCYNNRYYDYNYYIQLNKDFSPAFLHGVPDVKTFMCIEKGRLSNEKVFDYCNCEWAFRLDELWHNGSVKTGINRPYEFEEHLPNHLI